MPFSFHPKISTGYIAAIFFLLLSFATMFFTIQKLFKGTSAIEHTYSVVTKLEELRSSLIDVETGARGFVITGEERFLQPYQNSRKIVPAAFEKLKQLTADNPSHQKNLVELDKWVRIKMNLLDSGIQTFRSNGLKISDNVTIGRAPAREAMDSALSYISKMKTEEEGLMAKKKTDLSQSFINNRIITIVSMVIVLIAFFFSWSTYYREKKAKKKADIRTADYREMLEKRVKELDHANNELEALRSTDKFSATGRVARTIAHEVRNPLTNISLAADQLRHSTNTNADANLLLDMISRNATRIDQLVSDLLNATRFEQLNFREVNINKVLDETIEMAKDRIDLNQVKVIKKYEPDLCTVIADPEKIKVAFLNIIVNAIEAMEKEKGILEIATTKLDSKCIIEIKDNGVGMDDDTLQKLFDPYFTAKPKGNGLGLTNTQNIILNHRGNLRVQSKPKQGTSFSVILNISKNPEKV